ncbi:MAG: glycosyltransferase family 2 protein [Calditrichia bacterium]
MTPSATKKLSIIIVSYNTRDVLHECLRHVERYVEGIDSETFVVDNGSKDGSPEMVSKEFPWVKLIASSDNNGFAKGNNLAFEHASGEYVLLLNSDAYLKEGVLNSTLGFMEKHNKCGVLGIKMVGTDGDLQPSARMLPGAWKKFLVMSGIAARFPESPSLGGPDYTWWDHSSVKDVGWVVGAYFLIRRELVEQIGFLDERYFMYFEEIDFCLQAQRAGWRVVFFPEAEVIHLGGQSSGATKKRMSSTGKQLLNFRIESEFRYYRKNYGLAAVLASAGVELFWRSLVWCKNSLGGDEKQDMRREEAAVIVRLIVDTLRRDGFGRGVLRHG